ncbi:MAG TPA: hypothetical protein VL043_03165 [Protaetiibacter sp.]|nr:hypothetical protein [Protaetiibacter sp.]
MLEKALPDDESGVEAIRQVLAKLGISTEALWKWRRTSEIDSGERSGMTSIEHAELKRLKKENVQLRRANEILMAASASFAAELDRPTPQAPTDQTKVMPLITGFLGRLSVG